MADLKSLRFPGLKKYTGRNPNSRGSFVRGRPVGILLHYTAGGTAWERLAGQNSKVSAHFTVARNGDSYQCGDLDQRLWHAGESHIAGMTGLNDYYIGIEQANYGFWAVDERKLKPLQHYIDAGWLPAMHKYDAVHNPTRLLYWEPWPEVQLAETEAIVRWLIEEIPTIRHIDGHDDVSPGRKSDPGPAFPMNRFRNILKPDSQSTPTNYKVISTDPLNVRGLPAATAEKLKWAKTGLKPGTTVQFLRADGAWSFVQAGANQGWVYSAYLQRV